MWSKNIKTRKDQFTRVRFIKRVETLKRKAYELSKPCDIEVVLICSEGYLSDQANRNHRLTVPHIWPEDQSRVFVFSSAIRIGRMVGQKGRKSMKQITMNHNAHERKNRSLSIKNQNMFLGMIDSKPAAIKTKKEELSRVLPVVHELKCFSTSFLLFLRNSTVSYHLTIPCIIYAFE